MIGVYVKNAPGALLLITSVNAVYYAIAYVYLKTYTLLYDVSATHTPYFWQVEWLVQYLA